MVSDYTVLDVKAETAILESRLKALGLPEIARQGSHLRKLLENPGSMLFCAIETPRGPQGPKVSYGWFSSREREALRKALLRVNEARVKRSEKPTTVEP